jgi:hypothetical protein
MKIQLCHALFPALIIIGRFVETVSALSQLAAGLASGIVSNSSNGAVTGAGLDKNAVENNTLGDDEELEHEDTLGIHEPEILHITNGIGQKHNSQGHPIPGSYGVGIVGPVGTKNSSRSEQEIKNDVIGNVRVGNGEKGSGSGNKVDISSDKNSNRFEW